MALFFWIIVLLLLISLYNDYPAAFWMIIAIMIVFFLILRQRNEEAKKEMKIQLRKNREIEDEIHTLLCQIEEEVEENFDGDNCSRCNENSYDILKFNTNYDAVNVECNMCNKKIWVKTVKNESASRIGNILNDIEIKSYTRIYHLMEDSFTEYDHLRSYQGQLDYYLPDDINFEPIQSDEGEITYRKRKSISDRIKNKVWKRDEGKCVQCGSNKNLEFDHIIPHSKGGADTYRNLQLLCEPCNRSKSAKI